MMSAESTGFRQTVPSCSSSISYSSRKNFSALSPFLSTDDELA